ncbi:MAG TPA: 30S ribosomal protein S8e [archaeon]|nr:30S ribosomal protein S8e [archaeon]HLD80523.1 30S ribosomal protein S8e [archaeon]
MAQWQTKSRRTASGGFNRSLRRSNKKKHQLGGFPAEPKLVDVHSGKTEEKRQVEAAVGIGNDKVKLKEAVYANVSDAKGKIQKVRIENVVGNAADEQFVRRNIITKGCVIQTPLGNAKVTSRPGQDGTVNAVIIAPKTA